MVLVLIALVSVACRSERLPLPTEMLDGTADTQRTSSAPTAGSTQLAEVSTPSPEPLPERTLTICLGREPRSLFVFEAASLAAQNVLAAVYDGPFDIQQFAAQPVILERLPSLGNGEAVLQAVEVERGAAIVDAYGNPTLLEEGVTYRPSGCVEAGCAQTYTGDGPASLDQLVLRFRLKPGLLWSDGVSLTAADSVYAFEIAEALYPAAFADLVDRTQSYRAIDDLTAEWVGLPGYQDGLYHSKFFIPLPRHAWEEIPPAELRTAEASSRKPLGWGAYVIDEWVAGEYISLHKNPLYFRSSEGLPRFDRLVYRFTGTGEAALAALVDGECDLVDQSALIDGGSQQVEELQQAGRLLAITQTATAWELLAFGITSSQEENINLAGQKELRQAIAGCIDRQALAELYGSPSLVADAFTPPMHPLYNPQAWQFAYDPQAAGALLESSGWQDLDTDPLTPRTSSGVPGLPDGTPLMLNYLVSTDAREQAIAQAIQASLAQCGIGVQVQALPLQEFLAPGPDGPVFGRQFELAQYAWMVAQEPPCALYLSSEIPGDYPGAVKGWGGVNSGGYANPEYDQVCTTALYSLPDLAQHQAAHFQAQAIYAGDLPSIPLFWHAKTLLSRPDMCGMSTDPSPDNFFQSLEQWDYGTECQE